MFFGLAVIGALFVLVILIGRFSHHDDTASYLSYHERERLRKQREREQSTGRDLWWYGRL